MPGMQSIRRKGLKLKSANEHPQPLEEEEREPSTNSPGAYPRIGSAISIHVKSKGEIPAMVTQSSLDEVCLELARPLWPLPFRGGSQVRIKYWDEGAIAYFWEAEILKASKRSVVAKLLGEESPCSAGYHTGCAGKSSWLVPSSMLPNALSSVRNLSVRPRISV